jgi:carbamoyltransferase
VWTLGINWEWHDSAAALVDDSGRIRAFAEEERFSRVKRAWDAYPVGAAQYCLPRCGARRGMVAAPSCARIARTLHDRLGGDLL